MKRDKTEVQAAVVFLLVLFVIAPALWLGGGNVGATIKEAIRIIVTWGICAFFYVIACLFFRITLPMWSPRGAPSTHVTTLFEVAIFVVMAVVIVTAYVPGSESVWVAIMETIELIAVFGIIVILLVGFCVIAGLLYGDQVRASSRKNGR